MVFSTNVCSHAQIIIYNFNGDFQHLIDKNTKLREKNGEKVLQMRETVELFINTNLTVRFDSNLIFF